MPRVGFESTILAFKMAKAFDALDSAATVIAMLEIAHLYYSEIDFVTIQRQLFKKINDAMMVNGK
jgi:hypothetical protein